MKPVVVSGLVVSFLCLAVVALAQSPAGYLGLVAKPVPRELARPAGLSSGEGAQVVEVVPGGPAAAAGVSVGDLVVAVDGHKVQGAEGLAAVVASRRPGTVLTLEVVRHRVHLVFRVLLGAPRPGPSRSDLPKAAGASVRS